jgi:hypothetical protein
MARGICPKLILAYACRCRQHLPEGHPMIALNQRFEDLTITLDGGTFHGCTFVRCRLRFSGLALPELGGNKFEACEWDFIGPASNMLAFLQTLYHDHGGTDLVERIFGMIRERRPLARIAAA